MAIRNSEALDIFLKVAADARVSWHAVEIAGRGVSADARGVLWVLSVGKGSIDGDTLADLLIKQGDLVDSIVEAWKSFDSGETTKEEFEFHLERLVERLERWSDPSSL